MSCEPPLTAVLGHPPPTRRLAASPTYASRPAPRPPKPTPTGSRGTTGLGGSSFHQPFGAIRRLLPSEPVGWRPHAAARRRARAMYAVAPLR